MTTTVLSPFDSTPSIGESPYSQRRTRGVDMDLSQAFKKRIRITNEGESDTWLHNNISFSSSAADSFLVSSSIPSIKPISNSGSLLSSISSISSDSSSFVSTYRFKYLCERGEQGVFATIAHPCRYTPCLSCAMYQYLHQRKITKEVLSKSIISSIPVIQIIPNALDETWIQVESPFICQWKDYELQVIRIKEKDHTWLELNDLSERSTSTCFSLETRISELCREVYEYTNQCKIKSPCSTINSTESINSIFISTPNYGWQPLKTPPVPFPWSTLAIPSSIKNALLDDVQEFDTLKYSMYEEKQIMCQRVYLLQGPAGVGKRSLMYAMAAETGHHLCMIDLKSWNMTISHLMLFNQLRKEAILVLEHVDRALELTPSLVTSLLDMFSKSHHGILILTSTQLPSIEFLSEFVHMDKVFKFEYIQESEAKQLFQYLVPTECLSEWETCWRKVKEIPQLTLKIFQQILLKRVSKLHCRPCFSSIVTSNVITQNKNQMDTMNISPSKNTFTGSYWNEWSPPSFFV